MKKTSKPVKRVEKRNPALLVRLPAALKERLEADAAKYDCTAQAMLLWIAGQHYGIDVPEPARGRPVKEREQ